ncbi:rhodopsin [Penaeus vannamei]|uniref:Rhodopsin n=1 Tax=Penaeus vannamei TaxID=6689 RepID=A0A423TMV0_PENVA|nr:rhodopsin [Penaeus vannamei]
MTPPLLVNAYWGTWVLGAFFCEIYAFFGSFFGCVSIWSMVFITADRYNVIVKGVSAEPLTSGGAMLRIAGTWAFTLACYTFIVKAVAAHEKGMREQAKKMGVKSLRSEEAQKTSAECRLCKVALMTVTLWFVAWTPYFVINWGGMFNKPIVTPLFSIWGSVFAKANAVYNPIVYAISHPKYRAALEKKLPCLACATEGRDGGSDAGSTATAQSTEKAESA